MVSKEYIEDLVIAECRKLLTDKNIDEIAKEVVAMCEVESLRKPMYLKAPELEQDRIRIEKEIALCPLRLTTCYYQK